MNCGNEDPRVEPAREPDPGVSEGESRVAIDASSEPGPTSPQETSRQEPPPQPPPLQTSADVDARLDADSGASLTELLHSLTASGHQVQNPLLIEYRLPPRDQMAPRLVPLDQVERLFESSSDEALWLAIATTLGGALLGMLASLSFAEHIQWPLLAVQAATILLFAVAAMVSHHRVRKRAATHREKLFRSWSDSTPGR